MGETVFKRTIWLKVLLFHHFERDFTTNLTETHLFCHTRHSAFFHLLFCVGRCKKNKNKTSHKPLNSIFCSHHYRNVSSNISHLNYRVFRRLCHVNTTLFKWGLGLCHWSEILIWSLYLIIASITKNLLSLKRSQVELLKFYPPASVAVRSP